MSEKKHNKAALRFIISSKFKMPFLFWLAMLTLVVFLVAMSSYLVGQNENRVTESATLSANSTASFATDYIEKHKLLVKTIARHHQERILQLSKGAGYPYDLAEIQADISQLFPVNTEFAIINRHGRVVIGSDVESMGRQCRALIKKSMGSLAATEPSIRAHSSAQGGFHFDILHPIMASDELAGLWVKLSFEPLQRFVVNQNVKEYQLVISEQVPPYNILVGAISNKKLARLKFDFINAEINEAQSYKESLAIAPIEGVPWQVKALLKTQTLDNFKKQMALLSLVTFFIVFIVVGSIILIVRQAQLEREKFKQDATNDELFNAGPTVLLEKNVDMNMSILYASPNASTLFGESSGSLVNRSYLEWIFVEDVQEVRQKLLSAYKLQQPKVEMVYRIVCPENGGFKWIYDFTHIKYNSAGKPDVLRGYITSIHAQKTAEKNAIDLIQSVPEAIFVTDLDGRIVNLNRAAEKLLGCKQSELEQRVFSQWLEPDSFNEYERVKRRFLKDEELSMDEAYTVLSSLVLKNLQNQRISVEISFNQIELNGESLVVQVVRDVTLQVQTQMQLSLAKEQAEALARARSRFVATISHEIRTPMNGVLGMADLLSDTTLNETQQQYLVAIKQSGDMLLKIINEVLDFAKLDEGQVVLVNEPFNLPELLQEVMQLLSATADEKQLPMNIDYLENFPQEFIGDARRIQQLLLNLLSNALKFTETGSVLIKVGKPTASLDDTSSLRISVVDTGIGIAEENQAKLFDSFTQADDSTSRQFGGTGLGLAICKQLVKLMGGEIGVHSELDKGSEFWIELPLPAVLPKKSVAPVTTPQGKSCGIGCSGLPMQNCHVLVIEDNKINQNVIEAFLKRLGATVDIAENGLKGLDYWRTNVHKYRMILMDCQMPVMDGFEATRMIRKEESLMHLEHPIPIVALTANVIAEDKDQCLQVGMNDFLAKPIERDSFDEMMLQWCCRDD